MVLRFPVPAQMLWRPGAPNAREARVGLVAPRRVGHHVGGVPGAHRAPREEGPPRQRGRSRAQDGALGASRNVRNRRTLDRHAPQGHAIHGPGRTAPGTLPGASSPGLHLPARSHRDHVPDRPRSPASRHLERHRRPFVLLAVYVWLLLTVKHRAAIFRTGPHRPPHGPAGRAARYARRRPREAVRGGRHAAPCPAHHQRSRHRRRRRPGSRRRPHRRPTRRRVSAKPCTASSGDLATLGASQHDLGV